MSEPEPARRYHELTAHRTVPPERPGLTPFRPLDPANRPAPFKRYRGIEPVPLPGDPPPPPAAAAVDVLSGSVDVADRDHLDAAVLGRLLHLTAGVTREAQNPAAGTRSWFRAAMSAGNLHPVEVYVVTGGVDGVEAGVHHYAPLEHGLTRLRDGDWRPALAAASAQPALADAPAVLVLTGIPWRTAWKYGERGYRHLWWDAGTQLANLLAAAAGEGTTATVRVAFVDRAVEALVGVDGIEEMALAVVALGATLDATGDATELEPAPPPLPLEAEPLALDPVTFPLVTEVHRAGALGDPESVVAWRGALTSADRATPPVPPPDTAPRDDLTGVVLRRGSTRELRRDPVPLDLVGWGLATATRAVPWDVRPGATLLEHYLAVHATEGLEPGSYRWREGRLRRGGTGDLRDRTRHLCLDQPLGGDAAVAVFHAAHLEPLLDALGPRGYRAANLEAGVVAERLALAAFSLGYGATGLTFYDDEVARHFATDASCLLVTALGVPGYGNRAGGWPGERARLARYGELMVRLSRRLHREG